MCRYDVDPERYAAGEQYWIQRFGGTNGHGRPGDLTIAALLTNPHYQIEERRPAFEPAPGSEVLGEGREITVVGQPFGLPAYLGG